MVVQCQMVGAENIHTSNIIKAEQGVFRNIYIYIYLFKIYMYIHTQIYIYAITINGKRGHD